MRLAAFVLSWLAVTHDCRGGMEAIPVVYEVLIFEARVTGTAVDGNGDSYPVYTKRRQYPLTVETSMLITEPAPPALGEVTYIGDPVAIDPAGNRSTECS